MVQDLISVAKYLIGGLRSHPLLGKLLPILTLMGSIVEGTRIGSGNETDLMLEFEVFKKKAFGEYTPPPPFKVEEDDPFHLKATEDIPYWMEKYLDAKRRFIFQKFMKDLLDVVSSSLDQMYKDGKNPKRLLRKTSNEEFMKQNCINCKNILKKTKFTLFKQCKYCIVTVSQTKVGVGLQFLWTSDMGEQLYCSVDVVPVFNIQGIQPLHLANILNSAMLNQRPDGWMNYMRKYANADLIVTDLMEGDRSQTIESVLLKNLNCSVEKNYFVRPGTGIINYSSLFYLF
jgi:hypothetical protein